MKIIQTIIQKLACVAVLAAGGALLVFHLSEIYELIVAQVPTPNTPLRVAIGSIVAALAIFALLPLGTRRRKSQRLTFAGTTIQLDPVAATLNKAVNKLPVVKKASVVLRPAKGSGKADVVAEVNIRKPADTTVRVTADQLRVYIDDLSRQILGADEIGETTVNIVGIEIETSPTGESFGAMLPTAETPAQVAQPVEDRTPFVHDIPESRPVEAPAPSSDLMSYEESARVAEAEAAALSGNQAERELPVAWNQDEESDDRAEEMAPGPLSVDADDKSDKEAESEDDTSFSPLSQDASHSSLEGIPEGEDRPR